MKISLVTPVLSDKAGGAEYVVCSLANAFSRDGHDVEILHYADDAGAPFYDVDPDVAFFHVRPEIGAYGGVFHRVLRAVGLRGLGNTFPKLRWAAQRGAEVRWLKSYWRCYTPDLVIAFTAGSFSITAKACTSLQIPFVLSVHNVPEREFDDPTRWDPNPEDRARRKAALDDCAAITILSTDFKDYFPARLHDKIHVIPNFVHVQTSGAAERTDDPRRIISVGRLSDVKQHECLVEAWRLIAPDFPAWSVAIYGDGPLRDTLKAAIDRYGLNDSISINAATPKIWDAYAASSFMVHPARFEGFGLVVLEAMHCSIPTIAFRDCPGVNALIIDGETGILADPGHDRARSLADEMRNMMTDPDACLKMGRAARDRAKIYSVDSSLQVWKRMFADILKS